MKLDDRGRPIEDAEELERGENVLIVDPIEAAGGDQPRRPSATKPNSRTQRRKTQRSNVNDLCDIAPLRETFNALRRDTWPRSKLPTVAKAAEGQALAARQEDA